MFYYRQKLRLDPVRWAAYRKRRKAQKQRALARKRADPLLWAELWDTLLRLRNREIPPQAALAVAANAREIMRVVKAELQIAAATGTIPSKKMIGTSS